MHGNNRFHATGRRAAAGLSLIGLLFWLVLIGFFALIVLKTFPAVNEYLTIERAVNQIAHSGASTVPEIRAAFEKQKEIEYSISSIGGKDLEVTKDPSGDKIIIGFKYDKEVQLYGPVSLLIHFEGQSK
jgi:hypothetical protein